MLPRPSIAISPMMSNVSVSASLISVGTAFLSLLWISLRAASRRFSFQTARSMSPGWFSISLICAVTSAFCACATVVASTMARNHFLMSEVSEVEADAGAQLVAGRRRDARHHHHSPILGRRLEPVDAVVPVEPVVVGLVVQGNRAAVDEPPARVFHGALSVLAVGQRATELAVATRA